MSQPKPKSSLEGEECPFCEEGRFRLFQTNHVVKGGDDAKIEIADVWVDQCSHCNEVVFPPETSHFIEGVIKGDDAQLSPRELERIREDFDVDQSTMSFVLGLGEKTYHRWENGVQYPSRSMCLYIRAVAEFPNAFRWLKDRGWTNQNRVKRLLNEEKACIQFPSLSQERLSEVISKESGKRRNPARGFSRLNFSFK